jgi:hypothetical protein
MVVENIFIQILKVCEPILGFLNSGSGAAIVASLLTFWFSRWSAGADRKEKFKDCRESFQKILPNYIERIKKTIETLNFERIRLSKENAEGPNTGSLASGKLLEVVVVRLKLITNLPFTGFFSYPEVVEAYTDKSHKSKLKHVRKTELIHKIFGSFESVYSTQIDFRNLHKDSEKERIERIANGISIFQKIDTSFNDLRQMSPTHHQSIQDLVINLNLENSKPSPDLSSINNILKNFNKNVLFQGVVNPYLSPFTSDQDRSKSVEIFKEASSLRDAIIAHDRVLHSVIGIEKQMLMNLENTHDSLKRHLEKLELYFKELYGEPNGDN